MLANKKVRSGTLLSLFALGLAACSEVSTAPPGLSPDAGPLLSSGSSGSSGRGQDVGSRVFTIWPGAAVFEKFGDHTLYIPANATCDPATSGYGAAHWDAPCAPARAPIQVTATWSVINDRPVVSFSPDLRFAPSADESRWVTLWLKDSKGIDPSLYYAILWFDKEANGWVDESVNDSTLKARTNQSGNFVSRRLKHFSDYWIYAGFGAYNVTSGMGGTEEGAIGLWGAW
jgi:hypothetical protein